MGGSAGLMAASGLGSSFVHGRVTDRLEADAEAVKLKTRWW
jgi:hypothetical protein